MTIHDRDKLLIIKDCGKASFKKGDIVFARGTTVSTYPGKINNLPIYYRDSKGMLQMGTLGSDMYELIELKYIPLYRLLYEI